MDITFDPYSTLGVARQATDDDIKKAYRRLAQRLHPDKNPGSPGADLQFRDVQTAYNVLSDPHARSRHDQQVAQQENDQDTYFTLRVTPSKRVASILPDEQVIYLLAEIYPAPQSSNAPAQSSNINLTLVLDTSNSMRGTRLERVKLAAQRIVEDLSDDDVISVIAFNDRATVIIPATTAHEKSNLRARISMISAQGGTEIFHGLNVGLQQNRTFADSRRINSVILLTDGHTFGDQDKCLEVARQAADQGIVISAMGLGSDWNDQFLDQLASTTGGASTYISHADTVLKFFHNHMAALSNVFAERLQFSIAPDPDIRLEMAFRLSPNPQPLLHEGQIIPLSSLQANRSVSLLLQFTLPANMNKSFRTLARLVVSGDIMQNRHTRFKAVSDISIEITDYPQNDEPPNAIMEALSKLTLYRLQEKARDALDNGRVEEATRRLKNLATRLLEMGQTNLADATLAEATRVAHTQALSAEGRMVIKYQTRALIGPSDLDQALNSFIESDDS